MASWSRIARRIRVPLGFAIAAAYVVLCRPTRTSVLTGVVFAIAGLTIRALASGHVKKNEELTISGPYAYTRNPLYFGSLVLAAGFAIAARSCWIAVILLVVFAAIYVPVIRGEEEFLSATFSNFEEYRRNVPRLFPRVRPYVSSANSFSWHLYWKHREYNAFLGTILMLAVLAVKLLWTRR